MTSAYHFEVKSLDGKTVSMSDFRGQVVLVVNVASQCGFTPQYKQLEQLYQRLKPRGFTILAFPCNQFGNQEPGDSSTIQKFCSLEYRITFPVMAKIDVNGAASDPFFAFLKKQKTGLFGTEALKWNFTKFLIDRKGAVVGRYAPFTDPDSLEPRIQSLLET